MPKDAEQFIGVSPQNDTDPLIQATDLLAEFRPGMTLSIRRLRPTWCAGFLERVECIDGDRIDIDYIINRWGGKVLGIKLLNERGKLAGSMELNLSSYPPKHEGRLCNPNDDYRTLDNTRQFAPQAALPQTTDPLKLMKFLQEQRQADMEQLRSMLAQSPIGQALSPQPQQSPLSQLVELGKTYKQLQGLFGSTGPTLAAAPVENPDLNIMGQITDLLKVLKSPSGEPRAKILPTQKPVANPAPQAPQSQNLASVLANMDESQYTTLLLTSLQAMPENKRAAIIEKFLDVSGLMDGDDDDDDTEDSEDESSRGTPRTDESNDPPDREGD